MWAASHRFVTAATTCRSPSRDSGCPVTAREMYRLPATALLCAASARSATGGEDTMSHDDQFTATGPPLSGSGKPRSAFSSRATGMVYGANVQGDRAGVYGESVRGDTGRDSDIEGVGVVGVGDNFGVYARSFPSPGRRGIAGLFAQHNRGGV